MKRRALFSAFALFLAARTSVISAAAQQAEPGHPPQGGARKPAGKPAATGAAATEAPRLEETLRPLVGRAGGLTADGAARRASKTSLQAAAHKSDAHLAESQRARAKVGWYPRLTFTARYTRVSPIEQPTFGPGTGNLVVTPAPEGPLPAGAPLVGVSGRVLSFPVILDQYFLQANLVVPLSDYAFRISRDVRAAQSSQRAAELNARAAELAAAHRGRSAYYGWAYARLTQAVAERTVAQVEEHLRVVQAAFDAQKVPKVDVLRVEAQLAQAELARERAQSQTRIAAHQLRTVMHDPSGRPYEIGENLFEEPSIRQEGSEEALVSRAFAQRFEFRALLAAGASLEARRSSARAGRWPRLDAFGNAYYANPNARVIPPRDEWRASWDVGVQLTWSPNDVLITDSVEREIEAQQEELSVQRRMLEDTIRQEVLDARERLIRARAATQASERGLAAAEEAYALRRLLFEVGRATSADLLDVETELLRARLEVVSAAIERRAAAADLAYAVGTDARQ